jgi:DNA-binding transcriptional LysR family regulator
MIDKLEFIIALSRERHFGHAAEACGVSQPTLSAGIKQLEDTLGVLLVERGSRFRGFTPEGERVLDWARRIVSDTRSMRQEIDALKHGLAGHIRMAAIPTALPTVGLITTPYRAQHPDVSFTVLSRNSIEILSMLENLEIDAGLTYLDNEPVGRVQSVRLYSEEYRLVIATDSTLGDRETVTWSQVGQVPLCLLTPDMQNRRIIDTVLRHTGAEVSPTLESDSIIVLIAHVRTGKWASVMPAKMADVLDLREKLRAIPIVEPEITHSIGLVVPQRNPLTPLINTLVTEAKQLAPILSTPEEAAKRGPKAGR